MALLGDCNWYLPRWLVWLPGLRLETSPATLDAASTQPSQPTHTGQPALTTQGPASGQDT